MITYTIIKHYYLKKYKLSVNEYMLCNIVHCLCHNKQSRHLGWCYMSRQSLAEEMNLSKRSIINLVEKMIKRGFLEKQEGTGYLKTNKVWDEVWGSEIGSDSPEIRTDKPVNNVPQRGEESLPEPVKKVHQGGEESSPYINIDINKDKNKDNSATEVFEKDKTEVLESKHLGIEEKLEREVHQTLNAKTEKERTEEEKLLESVYNHFGFEPLKYAQAMMSLRNDLRDVLSDRNISEVSSQFGSYLSLIELKKGFGKLNSKRFFHKLFETNYEHEVREENKRLLAKQGLGVYEIKQREVYGTPRKRTKEQQRAYMERLAS